MARQTHAARAAAERGRARAATPAGGEEPVSGFIEPIEIQEEMERSFLEYSMSVIVSRALPDVRDGLKPVHRRILYSMYDQGCGPTGRTAKCAKVVGEVMGTYHPHGDSAIYDALVRMVQDFSLRHPLIDGHGNFGGTGPDEGPAAMRYTECRLGPAGPRAHGGHRRGDRRHRRQLRRHRPRSRPSCRPASPTCWSTGRQGIAVGMATNIPPHNLGEVIDATIHLLDHPEATPDDLMEFVKGPGLPDRRADPGPPGDPRRLPHRPGLDQDAGRRRDRGGPRRRHASWSPRCRTRPRSRSSSRRSTTWSGPATSTASPRSRTTRPASETRLVIRAQARRQRQRRAEQPVQADPAADQLRRQHAGPGRRGAAHAEPGPGARRTTSPTRSRWSPAAREFRLRQGPGPGPHRRGPAQGHRHARRRSSPPSGPPTTGPTARDRADGGAVLVLRGAGQPHPRHDPGPPHPAGPRPSSRRRWPSCARRSPSSSRSWPTTAKLRGVIDDRDDRDPRQVRQRAAQRRSPTTPARWASRT